MTDKKKTLAEMYLDGVFAKAKADGLVVVETEAAIKYFEMEQKISDADLAHCAARLRIILDSVHPPTRREIAHRYFTRIWRALLNR